MGLAGAVGWIAGYPNAFPATCVELYRAVSARELDVALPLYRQLHPWLRWDSRTEFVQAIKLLMCGHGTIGVAQRVALVNVPTFSLALERKVDVDGIGQVAYEIAYGGSFYAIAKLDRFGLPFDAASKDEILRAGLAVMAAIDAQDQPVHPDNLEIRGCHHVQLLAPGSTAR